MRVMRLVNRRRSSRRTDEVDEASRALRLLAATHRGWTSGQHPLELEPALRPALTCTCSPQRRIRAFRRCAGKGWLHKLGGLLQLGQCFGAMRILGGLRVMGVRSCGSCRDETKARFNHAAVRRVLVAARGPTSSGSHSGCTQWISTVGSVVVAYSTQSARISRARMMAPRSGGARDSRSWHDLHAAHESSGNNRHVYGCTV